MAINEIQLGAAAGDGNGDGLREGGEIINANFTTPENAASKIVQASSADTTSDKVMLSDYAWRGAQLGDYFTYGGTANAITLTSANLKAGGTLIAGMKFRFKATTANTGATTITVDGGSTISCVTPTGVALPAGFIRTDVITECEYDGANFVVSRKIESGSNANGEWTRWEDGNFSVNRNLATVMYNSSARLLSAFTLPIEAVDTDWVVVASRRTDSGDASGSLGQSPDSRVASINSYEIAIYGSSSFSPGDTALVNVIATGKWY
jgi:hypothetical protein